MFTTLSLHGLPANRGGVVVLLIVGFVSFSERSRFEGAGAVLFGMILVRKQRLGREHVVIFVRYR